MKLRNLTAREVRSVRRVLAVGRGYSVGLDELGDKIARVRVIETGTEGVRMPPGTAVFEVWGAPSLEIEDLDAVVERKRPAGVVVAVALRRARWWHWLSRWVRWRRWVFRYRLAGVLRALRLLRPRYNGQTLEELEAKAYTPREKK